MSETGIARFRGEVSYDIADETIADLRNRYAGLTIDAERPIETYEQVRLAIADLRKVRVEVEKSRKDMKADALEYGRKVDAEAKRITSLLQEIEQPLIAQKKAVDDEKARKKREAEEAERRRVQEELDAQRKAEQERIEAEQRADRERVELERQEIAAERKRLDEERAAIDAERAAIDAEREAAERAKREREEAEALRVAEEAEARRQEALKPDREKALAVAEQIEAIEVPTSDDPEANEWFVDAALMLSRAAEDLRHFGEKNPDA